MNPADLPLRDIHLPAAVSWWPPAPGWWILATALILVLVGTAYLRAYLARRRRRLGRWLGPELQRVSRQFAEDGDTEMMLQQVSALLRRACLSLFPRQTVAGLVQDQWLDLLDDIAKTDQFRHGPGRILASAPYQRQPDRASAVAALELAQEWARQCSDRLVRDPSA